MFDEFGNVLPYLVVYADDMLCEDQFWLKNEQEVREFLGEELLVSDLDPSEDKLFLGEYTVYHFADVQSVNASEYYDPNLRVEAEAASIKRQAALKLEQEEANRKFRYEQYLELKKEFENEDTTGRP